MINHVVAPHHLLLTHHRLCLAAAAVSLALSLWALYLDPVVNNDGILYIKAAEHFSSGDWGSGFSIYKWPFYSLVIGGISRFSGLAVGHSAYFVNGAFYVFLVLGFIALVQALGGGKAALWSAAVVALSHPELNGYRSFIIRDAGYWACFLWSLAYFFAYLRYGDSSLLVFWAMFALLSLLFRIEGILLVTVLPACLYVAKSRGRRRTAAIFLLVGIGAFVAAASPLWHYISEVGVSKSTFISGPVQHIADSWQAGAMEILSRIVALQREFPGISTTPMSFLVYLCTAVFMAAAELIQSTGIVFSGLVVYASWRIRNFLPDQLKQWWLIVVGIQVLLVFLFVFSNFFLTERYPVGLALTVLAIVPLSLEDTWKDWTEHGRKYSWRGLAVAALLAIEAMEGLDVATTKLHIKDAGLWLRANAAPGDTVYSNDRILVYYSGLNETRTGIEYSWQAAMSEIWSDGWRDHDYFALVMTKRDAQYEVLLLQTIEAEPVKRFMNNRGDRVLIFSAK